MPETMRNLFLAAMGLIFQLFLLSCEKAISFTPKEGTESLVVEATIENGKPPVVILTRSLQYFGRISPELLMNSFVHRAEISISNGDKTHVLKEYMEDFGAGYRIYRYSNDTTVSTAFLGELGKQYSLKILVDGREYTANTTIPLLTKTLDTLWWKKAPDNPDTTKVVLMTRTTDPPGYGNYIRYFTKTNTEPFFPGLNSVADDQVIDGKTYEIQIDRGVDRNSEIDFEEFPFFYRGDQVTVKLCNIDKATYNFFRTLEFSYSSIGNPFSSPTKVLGNISGGALGYFGGYAAQYISLEIPK